MDAIIERGCGLDVHQATVVACVLIGKAEEKPKKEVRTFRTVTNELLELRDWLKERGVTHVAMESTGVYWKPVYALLEDDFELLVGNAQHIKNVPGRKTDVKDSVWLADLLRHGLIAKSFVPPKPIRELRELLRYRRKLVESRSSERNRLQNVLELANIKLASFVSDVFGVSGMAMLQALIDGTFTPEQMAELAKGRMRSKLPDLEQALTGRMQDHHRFLLKMQLDRLTQVEGHLTELEKRIETQLLPYQEQRRLLRTIPGVDATLSAILIAEMGVDMTVFKSAGHLASWAGVCPGSDESAGKRRNPKTNPGNIHLKTALVEAAHAASHKKDTYLKDKFFRLRAKRGSKRAAVAIGHKILVSAYHILLAGQPYTELGGTYLDQQDTQKAADKLVQRLERLGFKVALEPKVA